MRDGASSLDFIDESNPVRVIDVFVGALDLAEMSFERAEPAATGRPSYHPSVLLKLYIYIAGRLLKSGTSSNLNHASLGDWDEHFEFTVIPYRLRRSRRLPSPGPAGSESGPAWAMINLASWAQKLGHAGETNRCRGLRCILFLAPFSRVAEDGNVDRRRQIKTPADADRLGRLLGSSPKVC